MPTTPTNDSQNAVSVTNEDIVGGDNSTWAEHTETWDEATGTWANPGVPATKESQNATSASNEAQN